MSYPTTFGYDTINGYIYSNVNSNYKMTLVGKIFFFVLIAGVIIFVSVFARIANKKLVNDDYKNSIKDALKLKRKGDNKLTGFTSEFFVELYFILPTTNHFSNNPRLRISMNYKPNSRIPQQEVTVDILRKAHPNFDWVANCIRKDITIDKDGPKIERIKKELAKMESILKSKKLSAISEEKSEEYGGIWDGAMSE